MGYEAIEGNKEALSLLKNSCLYQSVAHSYMFYGEKGLGKKTIAKLFASALLCEKTQNGEGCGRCISCRQIEKEEHPDVHFIFHEKEGSISVDEIREQINHDIYIKPYQSAYKIYIVDEAEKMTIQAQNSLLKTIEEPPSYGLIVLLAENRDVFLPTVLSRCVHIPVRPVTREAERKILLKRGFPENEALQKAITLSRGNIGKSLEFLNDSSKLEQGDKIFKYMERIPEGNPEVIMEALDWVSEHKENIEEYLDWMRLWFRDVLIRKSTGSDKHVFLINYASSIKKLSNQFEYDKIERILEEIEHLKTRLKANVNLELSLELVFIAIAEK